jgi:hypothetical protein
MTRFEEAVSSTYAGYLLQQALDLEFMNSIGVKFDSDDLLVEEVAAIRAVVEERNRFEREEAQINGAGQRKQLHDQYQHQRSWDGSRGPAG